MKSRTIVFEEYEALRAQYLAVFKEDAPHCQPLEMEGCSEDMREALRTGIPLPPMPEGYVT